MTIEDFFDGLEKFKNDHLVGPILLNTQTSLSASTCHAQCTVLIPASFTLFLTFHILFLCCTCSPARVYFAARNR